MALSKKSLKLLFNDVFNSDGSVKACGRDKCINLIVECELLHPEYPKGYFGNARTGLMDSRAVFKAINNYLTR